MATRRRFERFDESVPLLAVEGEDRSVGETLRGFAQRGFEHEFTDGLARVRRGGLLGVIVGARQAKIEFFRAVGALSHRGLLGNKILLVARQCHDKTA